MHICTPMLYCNPKVNSTVDSSPFILPSKVFFLKQAKQLLCPTTRCFPLFPYYPLSSIQSFLSLISTPTGFLVWALVTRWAQLLIPSLTITYPAQLKIKVINKKTNLDQSPQFDKPATSRLAHFLSVLMTMLLLNDRRSLSSTKVCCRLNLSARISRYWFSLLNLTRALVN